VLGVSVGAQELSDVVAHDDKPQRCGANGRFRASVAAIAPAEADGAACPHFGNALYAVDDCVDTVLGASAMNVLKQHLGGAHCVLARDKRVVGLYK